MLIREKVEVPGYFTLAALILTAINQHNRRLTGMVEELLTPDTRALLDTLLRQENADEDAAGAMRRVFQTGGWEGRALSI